MFGNGGGNWVSYSRMDPTPSAAATATMSCAAVRARTGYWAATARTLSFRRWTDIAWDALAELASGDDMISLARFGVTILGTVTRLAGQMTVTDGGTCDTLRRFDFEKSGVADHFLAVTSDVQMNRRLPAGRRAAGLGPRGLRLSSPIDNELGRAPRTRPSFAGKGQRRHRAATRRPRRKRTVRSPATPPGGGADRMELGQAMLDLTLGRPAAQLLSRRNDIYWII